MSFQGTRGWLIAGRAGASSSSGRPFPDADVAWMLPMGVRAGLLRSERRPYGESDTPVRCLVAATRIRRGERIAAIPNAHLLTGRVADAHLRRAASAAAQQHPTAPLRPYGEMVARLQAMPSASPRLLASQDALLVTALLYICRSRRCAGLMPPHTPLAAWVRTLPARVPPIGVLLMQSLEAAGRHAPLARRLRLGAHTTPLLPDTDTAEAATELMVAAVEEGGLVAGLRAPRTEVVLTEAMREDFYRGRPTALTVRQFEAAAAHTLRHHSSAAARRLAAMEEELHRDVLQPLLSALSPLPVDKDEAWVAEEMEVLRWAHFTVRSRALNLGYRHGPAQLAVVPLLDRLNHRHTGANVGYSCRPGTEAAGEAEAPVTVTACRTIEAGEELTLHYGSRGQRGCLFGDADPTEPTTAVSATDARRQRAEAVTAGVRAIESRQRRELSVDEDDLAAAANDTIFAVPPQDTPSPSGLSARGHAEQQARAEQEATAEATWLWRYGFPRTAAERAYEASHLWSRGLRERLAHLTDVRRRGEPGAFVVGVPEGLEHLREQRDSLERERYRNSRVFPPQQV